MAPLLSNLPSKPVSDILIICTRFSVEPGSPDLIRDLADAFVHTGVRVSVCLLNWLGSPNDEFRRLELENGIDVLVVPPVKINKLGGLVANASKWLGSSYAGARAIRKHFDDRRFDAMLCFSPLVVSALAIWEGQRRVTQGSYAYLTDFFPFHQAGAGMKIGGKLGFTVASALETSLVRKFDIVGCMSPAGLDYARDHYHLRDEQKLHLLRLWGDISPPPPSDRSAVRALEDLPLDRPIMLFGGQISEGRGIEELLDVAEIAHVERPDLTFLFMGTGRLEGMVRDRIASGLDNIILRGPVPRENYLKVVAACDIGIVCTVADTGVPSFPSKTIDYLRAGVPVVASVEDTTDYLDFVNDNAFGVAVKAGDARRTLDVLTTMINDPASMARMVENGRKTLERYFDSARAAEAVLSEITAFRNSK